jgi:hypothetical protein
MRIRHTLQSKQIEDKKIKIKHALNFSIQSTPDFVIVFINSFSLT